MVRVSVLKALPTDDEITEAGCTHAAEYLARLKIEDEERYNALLAERSTPWGDEPSQPPARCVAHLVSMVFQTIEENSAGSDNFEITPAEVANWIQRNMGKGGAAKKA